MHGEAAARRVHGGADADVNTLAPTLLGGEHLLFADRNGAPPDAKAVRGVVATVLAGVLPEPRS